MADSASSFDALKQCIKPLIRSSFDASIRRSAVSLSADLE